jgi:hypothetical protein
MVKCSPDNNYVVIKATGVMGDKRTESYGEASPDNNKNAYPVAMAEKRSMARVVLKLAGLYQQGMFSEDEADEFRNVVNNARASYKGNG